MNTKAAQSSSPSSNSGFWPLLIIALSTTAGITFASVFVGIFTKNFWEGLLIAVLCLIALVLISFIRQIGIHLQNLWVEDTAKWVDGLVRRKWIRYQRYYARFLTFQHRDFDIKGLSTQSIYTLELDQVFVDLRIDPKVLHEATIDLLAVKLPSDLSSGQRGIWSYLESEPLQNQHLVILGPPGSGKTTLLKHLSLTLVSQKKRRLLSRPLQRAYRIPFLLFLREHAQNIQNNPNFSLVDAIEYRLADWERPVPNGWVQGQLSKGKCLLLLDGLDEVADQRSRERVVKWVQAQMVRYAQNRFLLSSRPFGYRDHPVEGVMVLEVQPFTFEQIQQFVQQWYLANEIMSSQKDDAGVRLRAKTGALDLVRRIQQTPALTALSVNPLLLTMIATIHRYRSMLPGKRVELYAEICEVFLGKRQQARDQHIDLRPAQSVSVLQPLAYEMMVQKKREISPPDAQRIIEEPLKLVDGQMTPTTFLQMVENMSGLLLEQKSGYYSFAHLTFQEYLAATHIEKHGLKAVLLKHLAESWWAETMRLYSAQTDATEIIAACFRQGLFLSSAPHLQLALECQEESLQIQPAIKSQIEQAIKQGVEHANPKIRQVVAETLLKRRIKEMTTIEGEVYRDTSLILCAEYQLFLDEQYQQGYNYQPEHWKGRQFPPQEAFYPVLGVRYSAAQAFCNWLTQRDQGLWSYRLPNPGEYFPEIVYPRPTWLGLRVWNGSCGFWRKQATFTWLKRLTNDITSPLNLDLNNMDDYQNPIDLRKEIMGNQQEYFLSYLADAAKVAVAFADAFTGDLSHISIRIRSRANALASDLNHAYISARVSDLALASALADASERSRILALASDLSSVLALDLRFELDRPRSSEFDFTLASDLANASICISSFASFHLTKPDKTKFFTLARLLALLSICISFRSYELVNLQPKAGASLELRDLSILRGKERTQGQLIDIQETLNVGMEINRRLELLEKRSRKDEPAYEGILIVKECGPTMMAGIK